ncbi:ThiF family adenylyltransferase [Chroococcidiopsidales cyanobacterium LEGE 13417]|nr:ThiF family adenylyltransferase [Chroococcidiopsidales cyanobacterium LEGE 13417]
MRLDLSYARSFPLMLADRDRVHFVVVGAGGTGGWIIGAIARLMLEIESKTTKTASCTVVDFDVVEAKNIPRQNFQSSEIGLFKAQVLAARYSLAWGCKISSVTQPFCQDTIGCYWDKLTVIVGCVDNAAARVEIGKCLDRNPSDRPPSIWWLDCGNHAFSSSGQVLLGSSNRFCLERAFDNPNSPNFCIHLPSPALQHPELLVALPEELNSTKLSCAEIQARDRQSLFVNSQVAAIASDYLLALTLTGGLRRFATYFDSQTGTARSLYNCPQTFKQFVSDGSNALNLQNK